LRATVQVRIRDVFQNVDLTSVRFQPVDVELLREQRTASEVHQVPAGQVPRVASAFHEQRPQALARPHRHHAAGIEADGVRARSKQNALAIRQHLRPAMRRLAGAELRQHLHLAAGGRYPPQPVGGSQR